MAAPKTAYSTQDIKALVSGAEHRLCRLPFARSAYSNENNYLKYFDVEKVFYTKDKNNKDCILGCTLENLRTPRHKNTRLSKLRVTKEDVPTVYIYIQNHKDYTPQACDQSGLWDESYGTTYLQLVVQNFQWDVCEGYSETYSLWEVLEGDLVDNTNVTYVVTTEYGGQSWEEMEQSFLDDGEHPTIIQGFLTSDGLWEYNANKFNDNSGFVKNYSLFALDGSGTTTINYQAFTDGGLNTLPRSEIETVHKVATNYAFVKGTVKGSFYLPTTAITLDARRLSNGTHTLSSTSDTLPSGATSAVYTSKEFLYPINLVTNQEYAFTLNSFNSEGSYAGTKEDYYTPYGPCRLITVYAISDISQNPTGGTPYGALIFTEDYANKGGAGRNQTFYDLFRAASATTVSTYLQTMMTDGDHMSITNCAWGTYLPVGKYYGFPTTYNGTDYKIVEYIGSGKYARKWYNSTYSPTYDYYGITIEFSEGFDTQVNPNTSSQVRLLKGNGSTNIATTTYGQMAGASTWVINSVPAADLNLTGEQTNKLSINLGNWTCSSQELVTLRLECYETGDVGIAESSSGSFEGTIVVDLGNLKASAVGANIHVSLTLSAIGEH